jgi:hypothetical protein
MRGKEMTGNEIYEVLKAKGVSYLHHANSVKTSLSLLELDGIASRKTVEDSGKGQTNQITDNDDKMFGIWDAIFVDTVDIHQYASNRNKYGPVMFVIDLNVLLNLPLNANVNITRSNPSKWKNTTTEAERYLSKYELTTTFRVGCFDHMLVIRTEGGILPFGNFLHSVILDDPVDLNADSTPFNKSSNHINSLLASKKMKVIKRQCTNTCKCIVSYAEKKSRIPYFYDR